MLGPRGCHSGIRGIQIHSSVCSYSQRIHPSPISISHSSDSQQFTTIQLWAKHIQKHVILVTSEHPESWPMEAHSLQGHSSDINAIAYSPDGNYIISGSEDKTIRVWNATTSQCVAGPLLGYTCGVICIAYSPDGAQIVTGGRDCTIRIWNATTGQCVAGPLQGHTYPVTSVAYSPNGSHVVSSSTDMTIKVWNVTTSQWVEIQRYTSCMMSVAYSPDGTHIVSGGRDHTIRI